ncbi:MAG: thiol reductant ABC exporter subunit CydD [Devosia sp.]
MLPPLAAGALLLVQAWLLASIIDSVVIRGVAPGAVTIEIATLVAIYVTRAALGFAGEVLAASVAERIKQRLRGVLLHCILSHRPVWTAAQSSGALTGLVMEQTEALDGYFSRYLPAMVQAAMLPLAFAIVVLPIDWVVAVIFIVTAPLIPVFMALAGMGAEAAGRAQAGALSRLTGRFADRLRGLVTLKLFGRAEAETAAVRTASDELRQRSMRVMRIAFLSSATLEFFAALGVAGVALYVGLTFLDLLFPLRATELTLAAGLFCLLMAPEVYQPLRLLAANYHDRAAARAAALEIEKLLGELPDLAPPPVPNVEVSHFAAGPPCLDLIDVTIATPAGRAVIGGLDLHLAPGEHLALLGPSGSGKSTLLEAIARLRDAGGVIRIDDRPLADMAEQDLRHDIGFLGQRPRIFAGTIADNIRFARPAACTTAVAVAARRAAIDCFADQLPDGLDTQIGENGIGLSGGEIHRIALARLYMRDPRLILLDEPTAHLDAATEAVVLDGLIDFARGRTMIVATHSLAVAGRLPRACRIADGNLLPMTRVVAT